MINAASYRNPSNISQIKLDRSELCQHILQQSNAKDQSADLIKKGQEVKASITELRKEVNVFLKAQLPKISKHFANQELQKLILQKTSAIQQINKTIADKYLSIMADISHYCENVMGKPPCEYAIVGMGSLAQEEITPYSDFEHIILLFDDVNYKSHLEYFRWFSVIFHIIIINVQESIIASFNVESLNGIDSSLGDWFYDDFTPQGVSFDGMMPHACKFPLGRQQHTKNKQFTTELIKPVCEMLEYLSSETNLKNGYHLADILTKTCFVHGNQSIFERFRDGTKNYLDKRTETDTINDIQQQVKKDLNKFSTRFRLRNLKSQTTINIKQFVYRSTTLFVSALSSIYKITSNSCFAIINQMVEQKKITQAGAEKLKFAIAIACEMRLRVYMESKSQCDNAIDLKHNGIKKFLNIVGVASTVNYFQIAYCLQCEVAKQLNFTKLHFYSDPQLINISIGLAFEIEELIKFSENPQPQVWESSKFNFDKCIKKLEKGFTMKLEMSDQQSICQGDLYFYEELGSINRENKFNPNEKIYKLTNYLCFIEMFDEALDFAQQLLETHQSKSESFDYNPEAEKANFLAGLCFLKLYKPSFALKYFQKSLEILENITRDANIDKKVSHTLFQVGSCRNYLQNSAEALKNLNRSLQIHQNITLNADKDESIAAILVEIGRCHNQMQNYHNALTNFTRSFYIFNKTAITTDKVKNLCILLRKIGRCHCIFADYNEALSCLSQSLLIQKNTKTLNKDTSMLFKTFGEIDRCFYESKKYKDALTSFQQSYRILHGTTLDEDSDRNIAIILFEIGRCHLCLQNSTDALTNLNRSLQITKTLTLDAETDEYIEITLHEIGLCQLDL